ncbi:MAG: PilZ domain-containing protein [Pseudomonadota bacterium]|nr:PilZ domain-containing protein [Pseudomonadota bacterium]
MVDILNFCRMLFKRRKYKRFNVRSGTFVLVAPGTDGERKVQIVDISLGGTAFIYNGRPEELEESGVINLLTEETSPGKLEFDTVSDIPVPGSTQSSEEFRRRGVKFKWLGVLDKVALNKFIEAVSTFYK